MKLRAVYLLSLCLVASACASGEVRDTLGLNRAAPDEFKVVSRPPLSMPPDFNLRPPAPGEPPRVTGSTEDQAAALLLKQDKQRDVSYKYHESQNPMTQSSVDTAVGVVRSQPLASTGEARFLSNVGAGSANPEIRDILYEDTVNPPATEEDNESLLGDWLGLKSDDAIVDPAKEAERLKANKETGKPVNEGDVPTVGGEDAPVMERLFE